MPDSRVAEWRKEGKHLPRFMRDFHDQKNLFKTIHEVSGNADWPDWMHSHIYALDGFLWFMARHGYTLQKTHTRLPFDDIETTLHDAQQKRRESEADVLKSLLRKPVEQ